MAADAEVMRLPIEGMTCDHCVGTVRRALEGVPGVVSATVDLAAKQAEVTVNPARADPDRLRAAIEAAGYRVPGDGDGPAPPPASLISIGPMAAPPSPPAPVAPESLEEWNLAVGGMHCASCVGRVEGALSGVPGVSEARVNLATERASVVVDPARVDEERLARAVAKAGYTARRAELPPGSGAGEIRRERAEQVAYWRNRLIVGVALTVPLVVLGYAPMLPGGSQGHRRWAAWVMFGLAGVLQAYLGGPYLRGAWGRLRHGSSNMDTLIALGTTAAFGSSVVHLLLGQSWGPRGLLLTIAVGIIMAVSLIGAVLFGEPPTFGREGGSLKGMPGLDEHAHH